MSPPKSKVKGSGRAMLGALVAPLSPSEFLSTRWPGRPHRGRMPAEAFRELASIPELASVESLCEAYKEQVDVWSKTTNVRVSTKDALDLYRHHRMTIYFVRVDRWVPELSRRARILERELGMLPGEGYCSAFASRSGGGAALHFDADYNFNIQLKGTKRWHLAENRQVAAPTQGYYAFHGGVADEMRLYLDGTLVDDIPEHAKSFTAKPGSVVYFPRGYWHKTEVDGDSLALDFTFIPATWATIAMKEIRRCLLRQEAWRGSAVGLGGGTRSREAARRRLAELFRTLPHTLSTFDPDAALDEYEQGLRPAAEMDERFVLKEGLTLKVRRLGSRAKPRPTLVASRGREVLLELELESEFVPVCDWLCRQREGFSIRAAQQASGSLRTVELRRTLLALRKLGVLETGRRSGSSA